tara:strand:- start:14231 stop:14353 length:123 start_codon:yes stop_codon:yes gene_type:complete
MHEQNFSNLMMEYLNESAHYEWDDEHFDESTFCIQADLER